MILPPATLGMLGGGQLGRFFVSAAHEMGYKVWVLDPDPHSPAGLLADRHLIAAYDDYQALDEFAAGCAAVTTEFENVPADTLDYLAKFLPVHPAASAVAVCQNRIAEKSFLADNGLPHGPFAAIRNEDDIRSANAGLFPAVLKVARFGYDGKGQARVADRDEALAAFQQFKGEPCVLEKMLTLDFEVSVVLARDEAGKVQCFPVSENRHRNGILDVTIAPAQASACLRDNAQEVAERIASKLAYVGTLGVEFFVCRGELFVNEMAPRPHNSGHHTIDACDVSQYEQQVRALCGLPLARPRQHSVAVMVNLLGELWYEDGKGHGTYREPDWSLLHAVPGLRLHLYAKHHARPGRKMGHFVVTGDDAAQVLERALQARAAIGIRDE
ncbi:5-(carboxyamino)imidazole ribonucleotide synthase [Parazoarcus communis]|uniref:N5-carboxyaminoimidazole ribonucleotide synthase n=1 Tax=Parazoarcus communis SWub3 = DSM 12120 TaxID=1121029 RepID=A0A323V0J9_9RHOO|nr:5-(carboxyamino)imidazole ribonucleotide synthase [Parazoarcus communis]NMG69103.1 5-(carboxyamino)imidazole ribonucleotide synthase [Parazoarcus communis SWub3 = DSM 12120]PZA16956.1 5-(carboxyamino)imidazole ribonucleotide synthase [Azoarcus communis] [Parazoarcus communis SWub3 = DSM 12120]